MIYRHSARFSSSILTLLILSMGLVEGFAGVRPPDAQKQANARQHYLHAMELAKKQDPDGAIAELRKAVALVPDAPDARFQLGFLLGVKGRLKEAIPEFQEVIRSSPTMRMRTSTSGLLCGFRKD